MGIRRVRRYTWQFMSCRFFVCLLIALGCGPLLRAEEGGEFFEKRIRPVLVAECYKCHSAQSEKLKGGLRLDTREGARKGGESGKPAVVPGDEAASSLLEAIRYENADLQMPPKKQLGRGVVEDFAAWIRMGAPDPRSEAVATPAVDPLKHWAFQPVRAVDLPRVKDTAWCATPIDAFVLSKLQAAGLKPATAADRRTLIRRAYYDLWGLPPSFEEVEAFEKDDSADAFEKVVDRLLASPRYGERWGRYWLDLARYADTKGYVYGDREEVRFVHSHNYRDWVIRALNGDMPYDRFVKLQIAADQMDTSREDLAAMGFLTLGRRFLGVMEDIVDDRIDVVTRTTQGLSVGCARCHDHKFDPIPTADYYSLFGVFAGSSERTVPLVGTAAEKSTEYAAYEVELKKRTDALESALAKKRAEAAERARARTARYLLAVLDAEKVPDELFYTNRDGDDLYPVIIRQWQRYLFSQGKTHSRVWGPWMEFAKSGRYSRQVNERVGEALAATPPKSMRDVAEVYGKLLLQADQKWKEAIKANPKAEALDDPNWEELRQVLYAADSPERVPEGSIADLEIFFDEGTRVQLSKLQMQIDRWNLEAAGATPQAVVLVDRPEQGNPRVFRRGNPATPGEEVPRRYLGIITGPDRRAFEKGSGRLEMAEAIANAQNPLTARVMVNRVWQWHFGSGLVKTPSDFGLRCENPSHPELLDWLAGRFVADGWSLKNLHRLIMLSSVYRQGGEADPRAAAVDPENRLLGRFEAHRLDFEALHDLLLAASGEIDLKEGGRAAELFGQTASKRRAIYGRVDRQFLPGVFRTFDFANPDLHTPVRGSTTVPQQALFMMNSPFLAERARALAGRKDLTSIADPAARVGQLYEMVYQRRATAAEVAMGVDYVTRAAAETKLEKPKPVPTAWEYGYGEFDATTGRVTGFAKLPHFTGSAWQGGGAWPDAKLGWAQLTADGGHAGNDLKHAVLRRWVSPIDGAISIDGSIVHAHAEGHGIVARIVSSRGGQVAMWRLHDQTAQATLGPITVKKGDAIDFIVSIAESLNNNDFLWSPTIKSADGKSEWNAKKEFGGMRTVPVEPLGPWAKYVQALLMSDEMVFVD
jgi:hypothetical protein